MNKVQILLIIGAGMVSFAGSFGVSWLVKKNQSRQAIQQAVSETQVSPDSAARAAGGETEAASLFDNAGGDSLVGMSEKQLQSLILEVRTRLQDYRAKEKHLQEETQRVEIARQGLQEEVDRLHALRDRIASAIQQLERQEKQLRESIVTVGELEKTNFQHLASTYDKMDSVNAGRILMTMASGPQVQDAVKILYYMNERTAAKVLGEISTSRPEAAAMLSLHLKRVKESE